MIRSVFYDTLLILLLIPSSKTYANGC